MVDALLKLIFRMLLYSVIVEIRLGSTFAYLTANWLANHLLHISFQHAYGNEDSQRRLDVNEPCLIHINQF